MKKFIGLIILIAVVITIAQYLNKVSNTAQEAENASSNSVESALTDEIEDRVAGYEYSITADSTVSYTAQKMFFSKPTEEVEGINEVSGGVDLQDGLLSLYATLDSSFTSNNSGRDKDIEQRLASNIIIELNDFSLDGVDLTQPIELELPLDLTINGVTQTVTFQISGQVGETEIVASGSSEIKLSDFDFEAPSALNIYQVNDLIGLSFEIIAKK